jgi:hypothetical protein
MTREARLQGEQGDLGRSMAAYMYTCISGQSLSLPRRYAHLLKSVSVPQIFVNFVQ